MKLFGEVRKAKPIETEPNGEERRIEKYRFSTQPRGSGVGEAKVDQQQKYGKDNGRLFCR